MVRVQTALGLLIALTLPFVLEDYDLYRFTDAIVFAIAILGLNLLTGISGQFSIGHSAFFAIGAYTVAMLTTEWGMSPYLALPFSAVSGFVFGFLFGWPALRFSTVHLALATWGLALVVPRILKAPPFDQFTGGVQGIYLDRPGAPFGLPLSDDQWWYLVSLLIVVLAAFLIGNLMQGRIGRALRALRDHPDAAKTMGINVALFRTTAFGVSGAAAGLAGGLAGLLADFVAPDTYTIFLGIALLIGAVAGGIDTLRGAFVGGLIVEFLPDAAGAISKTVSFPVYGLLLIALVMLMPHGVVPGLDRLWQRLSGDRGKRVPPPLS